jgi:hypothetical protein
MLAEQPKFLVMVGIVRRNHSSVAGRDELSRMEGKAGNVAVGFADFFPLARHIDFTPDRACRVFDYGKVELSGKDKNGVQIAGHSHLMNRHDRSDPSD